jgi:hypothetical protein
MEWAGLAVEHRLSWRKMDEVESLAQLHVVCDMCDSAGSSDISRITPLCIQIGLSVWIRVQWWSNLGIRCCETWQV